MAYNPETVLAEKIETVLTRNIANTRSRDFYDIHIIYAMFGETIDVELLRQALERTCNKRGSSMLLKEYQNIIDEIRRSEQQRIFWKKYQKNFEYAKDISFDNVCNTIQDIMNHIIE